MVSPTGVVSPATDFLRSIEELARILRDSQAQAMRVADKLLKVGVQQAVEDSTVGAQIDVTA
jgi:hypothetical protein